MAGIAGLSRWDMRGRLAARIDVVVTSGAGTGHHPGVGKTGGLPGGCGMAGIAGLGRRNMRGVLDLGIDGNVGAVMAARTVAGCCRARRAAVAHRRRGKRGVILVAGVALRRSGDMDGRFAQGIGAVMTGRAAAGSGRACGGVIVDAGRPGEGRIVASIALCSGLDMSRGLGLRVLGEVGAAVAGRTLAGQPRMAHHRGRPGRVAAGMAAVALGGGRDMR